MVAPLVALAGLLVAQQAVSGGVNIYNQVQQRRLFQQQQNAYRRQAEDFRRNTGRDFAYPEVNAPGRAYAMGVGKSQSYASGISSLAYSGGGGLYTVGRAYRRM